MTIKIIPATADDYPVLIQIWEASVRATHDFLTETHIATLRRQIQDVYMPQLPLWVASNEAGTIEGFIACLERRIEMLFVSPQSRGSGVGKFLINYAITELSANEVDVNEKNPKALGFYLHMGFESVGRSEQDGEGNPFPLLHLRLRRHN